MFRTNLERIGTLLLAEATKALPTVEGTVETPITTANVRRLAVQPVIVPVLRAGLGFVHAAQELMPIADVGFIGISRDEETFEPKPYVNKLPESLAGRPVIVIDPMLATGGSLVRTIELPGRARCAHTHHGRLRPRGARGASAAARRGSSIFTCTPGRSTTTSTTTPTSCPGSAMPETASSAVASDVAVVDSRDLPTVDPSTGPGDGPNGT